MVGVGLLGKVGDGVLVGVGRLREQATNVSVMSKSQTNRFMLTLPFLTHERACKPNLVLRPTVRVAVIYLRRRLPAASSSLPGDQGRRAASRAPCMETLFPCLALLSMGVAWPPWSPRAPVGFYPTFSPSPDPGVRQSVSVVLSTGHPAWVLPSIAPYRVRTFLGLGLTQNATAQPARAPPLS